MTNCEKCIHKEVCETRCDIDKPNLIKDIKEDYCIPDYVEIELKCKHFMEERITTPPYAPYTPPTPYEPYTPKVIPSDKTWPDNTCESCYWYKEHKDDPITVGDTPCSWCWKRYMTCEDTTIRLTNGTATISTGGPMTTIEMPKPAYDQGIQCINSDAPDEYPNRPKKA